MVDIAGPGFLNITLDAASAGELARSIVEAGAIYGHNEAAKDEVINLEFISANPTGPLHLGHTRWAALGDAMRRLLKASGADITAEYYINDAGTQMDNFGRSVLARAKGEPTPEGGYPGAYVDDLAKTVLAQRPDLLDLPDEQAWVSPGSWATRRSSPTSRRCWPTSAWSSTSGSRRRRSTRAGPSSRPSTGCASRATSTTSTARSGCAPPTSATTRTGSSSGPTASRPTSPPTPPTT